MKDINGVDVKDGDFCSFWNEDCKPINTYIRRFDVETSKKWRYFKKLDSFRVPESPFKKGDLIEVSQCKSFPYLHTIEVLFDHYDPQSDRPYVSSCYSHYKYARPIKKSVGKEHIGKKVRFTGADETKYEMYLYAIVPDEFVGKSGCYPMKYIAVSDRYEELYEKTGIVGSTCHWEKAEPIE